jgi:DNA-binding transcriptional LysR family regulator
MPRKIDWESQIGRRLKLRDLHVFLTVVQRGSMAKAAQQLGVSQPSVSEVIADLEHALGVQLLDRSARGVEPTAFGGALLKRSITVFDELKLSIRDIEFLSDQTAGEVRISAEPILARGFVATAIDRLTRRYPRIVCHVTGAEDYRALEAREVDLAIAFLAASPIAPDHMEAEILYDPARFVIAAKSNPLSRRRKVRLADLMNEPWALPPPDSPMAAANAEVLRAAGLKLPAATAVVESPVVRLALVAEGRFLTITSEATLRFAGRDMPITALRTDLPEIRNPVGIVTLKNRALTPVTQLFIECAREVAKPLINSKPVSAQYRRVQRGARTDGATLASRPRR